MSSAPRDASCSPPACANIVGVSATCLANPRCLCANPDTVQAVSQCLVNVCSLLDVAPAQASLLLQCQAVAVEGTPNIVPSVTASATSTVHSSTLSSAIAISSATGSFPKVKSSTETLHAPTTEFAQSSMTPSASSVGPSSPQSSSGQSMSANPVPLPHTSSTSPPTVTTPGTLTEGIKAPQTHGLSTSVILPLAVGLGLGIVLAALGVIYLRQQRHQRDLRRPSPQTLHANCVPHEEPRRTMIRSGVRHRPPILWLSRSNFAQDGSRSSDLEDDEAHDSTLGPLPNAHRLSGTPPARPAKTSDTRYRATRNPEAVWRHPPTAEEFPLPYTLAPPSYSSQVNEGPRGAGIRRSLVARLLSSIGLVSAPTLNETAASRRIAEPLPSYEASHAT